MDDNDPLAGQSWTWWEYPFWLMAGVALFILVGIALIIKGLIWYFKLVKNTIKRRDNDRTMEKY